MKLRDKQILVNELKKVNALWSYEKNSYEKIDDATLIEKVLINLDLEDIAILFNLFPKDYIKKTWKDRILSQEPYFHNLNKFIAWYYFNEEI